MAVLQQGAIGQMSVVASMQCPHCGKSLKIKNQALIGKSVKCPGCTKVIVVKLPPPPEEEEVELQLATDDPPVGTSPRIVSDVPLGIPTSTPKSPVGATANDSLPLPFPNPAAPVVSSAPHVADPLPLPELEGPAVASPSSAAPVGLDVSGVPTNASSAGTLNRLKKMKRRRAMGQTIMLGVLGLLCVGLLGGIVFMVTQSGSPAGDDVVATSMQPGTGGESPVEPIDPNGPYTARQLETSSELLAEFKPTSGEPLQMYMMPGGVNFFMHLRPAQLWSEEYDYQLLRAALTEDVTKWIETTIQEITHHSPTQIEEMRIGFLFGARGIKPDMAVAFRLKEPGKTSQLMDMFPGSMLYEMPPPLIKTDGKRAVLIHEDAQTIVSWPEYLAAGDELEQSLKVPSYDITADMQRLLELTDDERLFTMVGSVNDLRIHGKLLFPEGLHLASEQFVKWLGEDVEAFSWSLQPLPYLHSELSLRPVSTSNALRVRDRLETQLEQLPEQMWHDVAIRMHPSEMRVRNFVGRLPSMLEAFRQSTVVQNGPQHVTATTVLPAKAVPNMALAALFTVAEAARTDFSTPAVVVATNTQPDPKLPGTIVERIKQLQVDAEFERVPIEQAITYICSEVKVESFVDGDALKDAGWTKNMPQTFNLGKVSGELALAQIINKYQERTSQMVVSIDEAKKVLRVTTKKFAERDGLPIYEFPKTE
ncbi:MAG: hypothetical protein KDA58_02095 [Planctomycetaceae bacterium]|nr:hypothetical protein [Planctomycetaceae bacterium]